MTDTIDRARQILEARLAEIEAEADRVRDALARLSKPAAATPRPARARPSRGGRGSGRRRRARPGERERELYESIAAHPERRVTDHARALGVRPQQLYPLLHRLEAASRIEKHGSGYRTRSRAKTRPASAGRAKTRPASAGPAKTRPASAGRAKTRPASAGRAKS